MTETLQPPNERVLSEDSVSSPSLAPIVQRNKNGQLLPGSQLGKLASRKPSKNRITQQKLGIEAVLRDTLNEHMPEIVLKAIEIAKKGDRKMIEALLRLTISPAQAVEDVSEGKEKVQVTIRRLNIDTLNSGPQEPLRLANVIEGDFVNEQLETENRGPSDVGSRSEGGDEASDSQGEYP